MLDQTTVLRLLDNISKTSDKRIIFKNLVILRKDLVINDVGINLFYSQNGIKILVDLVTKPHEQILEVALSILGNCCTKKECCLQAYEAGILPSLIAALKSLPNPSIQCRACRLLGNLAEHREIISHIQDHKPAYAICSLLDGQNGIPVLLMAVRATRILWDNKKFQDECISLGAAKKIIQLLVNFTVNPNANDETIDDEADNYEAEAETVVLKRMHSPDRTVTKQKFKRIINDIENSRSDITGYEIVKNNTLQINSKKFIMPVQKDVIDLFTGILKFLQMITMRVSVPIAYQLFGDGNGYACLMFLCSEEGSKFRSVSLKILANLSSNSVARPELRKCDAVIVAANLLMSKQSKEQLDGVDKRYCVTIICLLTEDASNRLKIRLSGVFNDLLRIMKCTKCDKERCLILYGLYQFRYDHLGLNALIDSGIVDTLINILDEKLNNQPVDHVKMSPKKIEGEKQSSTAKSERQPSHMKRNLELSPTAHRFLKIPKFDYYEPESPGSSSSGYASGSFYPGPSSPSGSCYSPASTPPRILDDDDFDSQTYSPVCSDNEADNDENAAAKKDEAILNPDVIPFDIFSLIGIDIKNDIPPVEDENSCFAADDADDAAMDTDEKEPMTDSIPAETNLETTKEFEKNPITPILTLLWSISNLKQCHPDFVKANTLKVLLRVCCTSKNPEGKAYQALINIVSHTNNFVKIIQQNFIFQLNDLRRPTYSHGNCLSCNEMKSAGNKLLRTLGNVAESGYGRGEIAHSLVKKATVTDTQKRIAIISTHIIADSKILYHLLFQCNALDIILNVIFDETEALSNEAAQGLTILSINLNIAIKDDDGGGGPEPGNIADESSDLLTSDTNDEIVTFHVKDQQQFRMNKSTLIDNSDVFNSMFRNDFRESKHNEVHLDEISLGGIRYFCHLIKLASTKELEKAVNLGIYGMQSTLEAYDLSIKYILPELEAVVLRIIKKIMHDSSVLKVFDWSLRNMNRELLDTSIAYFLNCDISGERKAVLFRSAYMSSYKTEWHQLIVDTIFNKCSPILE